MKNFKLLIFTILFVIYPLSSISGGSFVDRICSSVKNFLNKESVKADTAVKDCKEKCDWVKKKQKLITAARKKANKSCANGIAPDMSEISKGLDKTAIEKLNKLCNTDSSKMFDGAEELATKDFNVNSDQTPTLTGNSGNVMILKAGQPDFGTVSGKFTAVPAALTTSVYGSTCDTCDAKFSLTCLQICCDEERDREGNREGDWCKQLCSMFPSDPRCKTENWFTNTGKLIKEKVLKGFLDVTLTVKGGGEKIYDSIKEWLSKLGKKKKACKEGEANCCGVLKYDFETQCCTGSQDIFPKKMKNLSDCEVRYQQDVPFEKKDCSVCGSANTILTWIYGAYNKNEPVKGASFMAPCFEHDGCYRTCKSPMASDEEYKNNCDKEFRDNMIAVCNNTNLTDKDRNKCKDFAEIYYDGVHKAGLRSYKDAQIKNCSCCQYK